jgi:hypothetical protein
MTGINKSLENCMSQVYRLIVLISFFLVNLSLNAQETFHPQTYLGIRQGINSTRVHFSPKVDQTITMDYLEGIVLKCLSEKNKGIQLELNYIKQDWNEQFDSLNYYSRQLKCLNIPFMSYFEFNVGRTHFFLTIGTTVSYVLNEKETIQLENKDKAREYYGKKIDNRFIFGYCGGVGIAQSTPFGTFQLEARATQSIIDFFNSNASSDFQYSKMQSSEVSLIYLLSLN